MPPTAPSPDNPPPARRTQAERRADSGLGLLRAAAALIAEEGVAAATLERVGARAGFSRGLATQRFGGKQALIEALIAHLHARLEALLLEAHVETMSGLDGVMAFAGLFLSELADDAEVRAYFMLMSAAVADRGASRAAFAASHERVASRLRALIQRGQHDGSVLPGLAAEPAAILVGSTLLGISTQHLIDPATDPAGMREAALAAIRRGLRRAE